MGAKGSRREGSRGEASQACELSPRSHVQHRPSRSTQLRPGPYPLGVQPLRGSRLTVCSRGLAPSTADPNLLGLPWPTPSIGDIVWRTVDSDELSASLMAFAVLHEMTPECLSGLEYVQRRVTTRHLRV